MHGRQCGFCPWPSSFLETVGPGAGRPAQLTLSTMPVAQLWWQSDSPGRRAQVFLPPLRCRLRRARVLQRSGGGRVPAERLPPGLDPTPGTLGFLYRGRQASGSPCPLCDLHTMEMRRLVRSGTRNTWESLLAPAYYLSIKWQHTLPHIVTR